MIKRFYLGLLALLGFAVAFLANFFGPGAWGQRVVAAALCGVLSYDSAACQVNLPLLSNQAVALDSSSVLLARTNEFDDPSPSGPNPQAPAFPNDPGPNFPVRPEFSSPNSPPPNPTIDNRIGPDAWEGFDNNRPGNTSSSPLPGTSLISDKCDFSTIGQRPQDQKCYQGTGNQCVGAGNSFMGWTILALTDSQPKYDWESCMVHVRVSPGSMAHDRCCLDYPSGFACSGYAPGQDLSRINPFSTEATMPCSAEWDQARADTLDHRGSWVPFGPYYNAANQAANEAANAINSGGDPKITKFYCENGSTSCQANIGESIKLIIEYESPSSYDLKWTVYGYTIGSPEANGVVSNPAPTGKIEAPVKCVCTGSGSQCSSTTTSRMTASLSRNSSNAGRSSQASLELTCSPGAGQIIDNIIRDEVIPRLNLPRLPF
ncbi:hypothetical protein [Limnothrix sp. PR1529]|uniref:hypothetical protein n=1 Tax=Limnothrix sp. PR1529 TaxID=1704291 RepID=UPI00117B88DB|nr:hypothetical protein [Limnothrix sp. PR1529]